MLNIFDGKQEEGLKDFGLFNIMAVLCQMYYFVFFGGVRAGR